jgi:hypothetical protein
MSHSDTVAPADWRCKYRLYINSAMLINFTDGKVDCYGIRRNRNGLADLKHFLRGGVGKYVYVLLCSCLLINV